MPLLATNENRPLAKTLLVIVLTFAAYVPAMGADFIWNDDIFLTQNPRIQAGNGLYRMWCTTEAPDYWPMTSTTLWIEWRMWGESATGYHVVNVILHIAASLLVWRVLLTLRIPGAWVAETINPNTGFLAFSAAFRSAGFMLSS